MDAQVATTTHYCKFPGCTNEASSPVGRYSYCEEHRGKPGRAGRNGRARPAGLASEIAALAKLAKRCDALDEKARRATEAALVVKEEADKARSELRARMAEIARGPG